MLFKILLHYVILREVKCGFPPLQVDDPQKRVNGDAASKKTSVPSRYHQYMTSEDQSQSSSAHSTEGEEEEVEDEDKTESVPSTQSVSPVPAEAPDGPSPAKESSQVLCCDCAATFYLS